jgi:hypothetical protein
MSEGRESVAPPDGESVTELSPFEIDFRRGGSGQECLVAGWSSPDVEFTWTLGLQSVMICPRLHHSAPHSLQLAGFPILRTDTPLADTFQRLGLSVNGFDIATAIIRSTFEMELLIPAQAVEAAPKLTINLALPDACAPSEFKPSGDHRKLAIGFSRMVLRPIMLAEPAFEPSAIDATEDRDILMQIHGLGANCELGFVQRHAKAEPFGLFRWASAPLPNLIAALEARFEGLGRPENIEIIVDGAQEFQIIDNCFGFRNHSFAFQNKGGTKETVLKREVARVPFLARLLIEELESAAKLFLFHDAGASPRTEVEKLLSAIKAYGDNVLLWVVPATSPEQVGTARLVHDRLICGYLADFQPLGHVVPPQQKSFEAWMSMLRQAHRIWMESKQG